MRGRSPPVRPPAAATRPLYGSDVDALPRLRQVAGAALDVFAEEPCTESPLFELDEVVVTPHLGASTEQAQINVAIAVAEQVRDFLLTGVFNNAVNVPSLSRELWAQMRPYITLGEKLGRMQGSCARGPSS